MENLRIYLLGSFRVYREGVLLTARDWQISHARQLFKLLFTERGHTVPVSKVIDLLWPDSAEHTHKTLRSVVSILRSILEPGRTSGEPSRFLPRGSLGYTLVLPADGSVWVDTIEFERLLGEIHASYESPKRRRLLEAALQLYTGDYLAEDEHESWTLTERARLREHYFSAALFLMEAQRKLGLYREAIDVGRRALSFDVCREPLYPIIMYCQAARGDTVGALQTFEQCRQELHNRLGVDPSPQTLKLHTELLRGDLHIKATKQALAVRKQLSTTVVASTTIGPIAPAAHSPKKQVDDPHLPHRDATDYLLHCIDELRDREGETRVIALVGEMGIGKSFLLRYVLDHACCTHIRTMVTSCQAIEQALPFASLLTMVKTWLAEVSSNELSMLPVPVLAALAHLLPELLVRMPDLLPATFLNAEQAYNACIAGFVDLFQALGQLHALVVAIDDLQWADDASVLVLHRLARSCAIHTTADQDGALLVLMAYRPEDISENCSLHTMLLSLSSCDHFHTLPLSRFSLAEVDTYLHAHDLADLLSPKQCYQITQGNALFLTEIMHLLADQKERMIHTPTSTPSQRDHLFTMLQRSSKIHDIVLVRLTRLPQRAVELLEYAAVIGRPFPPTLLGSYLSPEDYKLFDLLLMRRFLIEGNGNDYEVYLSFSHELVARIIYANCTALKRSQLHLQIAEQLVHYYASNLYATEIAFHYRHAGAQYQLQAMHYENEIQPEGVS